eukprot:Tamp_10679.p1 GENE.Tamp_10679~~Tamp_10679.p1  ORF type:complete len:326 (+),score=52.49 Tamp_10679:66-980(+)
MRRGAAHGGIQLGLALSAILASALLGSADGFAGGWGPGGLSSARLHPPRTPRPTLANVAMLANKERKRRLPFDGLPFTLFKGDQVATESLSSSAETLSLSVSDQKKEVIEACLEQYNAVYTILWEKEGDGPFRVKGAYTTEARRRAMRKVRGDDKTFASESAKIAIPSKGTNLIATASQTGKEVIISNPGSIWSLKRRFLAQEFGIKHIHFVPVEGGRVMEYGRLAGEELEIVRLLRLTIPSITQPSSLPDFFKGCKETFWLLMLLVLGLNPKPYTLNLNLNPNAKGARRLCAASHAAGIRPKP